MEKGDYMKKIIIILILMFGILSFAENIYASEFNSMDLINILAEGEIEAPNIEIGQGNMSCKQLLGIGMTALVKTFIRAIRIAAVIIAVVIAMSNFLPVISAKNPDADLKQAFQKTRKLLIALVFVVSFPNILSLIGNLFGFDLSCIF